MSRLVACTVCGAEELRPVLDLLDFEGRPNRLVGCRTCRLVQVEALPDADVLGKYYSRYSYDQEEAWRVTGATLASLERLARRLARYRKNGLLLDVGCGAGAVLGAMAGQGWAVEGTEISEAAAHRLRLAGFTVHVGPLEPALVGEARYDVVIMSEIIEHLLDPLRTLQAVARVLRPGGALYLTTPNFGSLSRRLLGSRWRILAVPEHLFYFCPASMRWLLGLSGLEPVTLWTEGLNPYELRQMLTAGSKVEASARAKEDGERLRQRALTSPLWHFLKKVTNWTLQASSLGDTLKLVAQRR